MIKGIFKSTKKDGSEYYRASIHRKGKKISLGSFATEEAAIKAYQEANMIYQESMITIDNYRLFIRNLKHEKAVCLINHRDNGIYIKTPIYLRSGYFSYYLKGTEEYKFDNEDLFYYSSHTIMQRGGHLFVNDYGSQYSLISRYGIISYGIPDRDFRFVNGDFRDYRYENILIINRYHGVRRKKTSSGYVYYVKIHINGEYSLGRFKDESIAAVCYNKGADAANAAGLPKNFMKNYIPEYTTEEYLKIYDEIELPQKYLDYISTS